MKQNKVFCDICGHDIELEKEGGMALFEHIKIESQLNLNAMIVGKEKETQLVKSSYDICETCAKKIEDFIKNQLKKIS